MNILALELGNIVMNNLSSLREGDHFWVVCDYGRRIRRTVSKVRKCVIIDNYGDEWRRNDGHEWPHKMAVWHARARLQ